MKSNVMTNWNEMDLCLQWSIIRPWLDQIETYFATSTEHPRFLRLSIIHYPTVVAEK